MVISTVTLSETVRISPSPVLAMFCVSVVMASMRLCRSRSHVTVCVYDFAGTVVGVLVSLLAEKPMVPPSIPRSIKDSWLGAPRAQLRPRRDGVDVAALEAKGCVPWRGPGKGHVGSPGAVCVKPTDVPRCSIVEGRRTP